MILAYYEGLWTTGVSIVANTFSHLDPVIVELTLSCEMDTAWLVHNAVLVVQSYATAGSRL